MVKGTGCSQRGPGFRSTQWLTTIHDSNLSSSNGIFWPAGAPGVHIRYADIHTGRRLMQDPKAACKKAVVLQPRVMNKPMLKLRKQLHPQEHQKDSNT